MLIHREEWFKPYESYGLENTRLYIEGSTIAKKIMEDIGLDNPPGIDKPLQTIFDFDGLEFRLLPKSHKLLFEQKPSDRVEIFSPMAENFNFWEQSIETSYNDNEMGSLYVSGHRPMETKEKSINFGKDIYPYELLFRIDEKIFKSQSKIFRGQDMSNIYLEYSLWKPEGSLNSGLIVLPYDLPSLKKLEFRFVKI